MSYSKFVESMRKITDVELAAGLMSWDQEVNMPKKGAAFRGQQLATLSGIAYDLFINDTMGELLEGLSADESLNTKEKKNVAEIKKHFDRKKKLSAEFVMEESKARTAAFESWVAARQANDFSVYRDDLKRIVDIQREKANLFGYDEHPYDALMDEYEPNAKASEITALFEDVKSELKPFLDEIKAAPQVDDAFLKERYDKDKQWDFGIELLKQMGYDFDAGRQDLSEHPFTIHFNPQDVRVTTRVDEHNFCNMTWSCIHEGGHALYEQGLLKEEYGLPSGEAISLGVHESQSRLWENNVGRSLNYWKANYARLQSIFPEQLGNVDLQAFYKAINRVEPSLVRTESDELTYHFHILIRFEIEKAMIDGSLEVKDVRDAWNEKYLNYLGVQVPDDKVGVLQDIHWSHGSIGYFPTYSLGSFYAAQYYDQAVKDVPGIEESIRNGDMMPMLGWLREKIHRWGHQLEADELCEQVTGEKLNFKHFMNYARSKYGDIYGL